MIILNMYGKIDPIIISNKLGIGISNPPNDWVIGLQDDIMEEILIREHNLKSWVRMGIKNATPQKFDPIALVKMTNWDLTTKGNKPDLHVIAQNLIGINVLDFENSYLRLKNDTMDCPTCEVSYPQKFIKFCNMIQNASSARTVINHSIPFATYSSGELDSKPKILFFLRATLAHISNLENHKKDCIASLVQFGSILDNFLQDEEDFWRLDYIINSMYFDREYNAYHVFKVMSLIEMIIINPAGNGKTVGELERKLPQFFVEERSRTTTSKKIMFAEIMRKLRNKIAHGDFKSVQRLLKQYRDEFMVNYHYDEFEYSIENWTYLNICCRLDEILNEIVWQLITDKNKMRTLQYS